MPSKRRGGFRPPELRGTLGTLLRTTTGVVRDAIERGAREGRARLDDARASRRRRDALADLGELVLELIRGGEIDLAELPEARDLVRELDELDEPAAAEPEPPRAATRRRFDDRGRPSAHDDDGTVSSGATLRTTRPTVPQRPRAGEPASRRPNRPSNGVWRPELEDAPARRGHGERARERAERAEQERGERSEREPAERERGGRADGDQRGRAERADGDQRARGDGDQRGRAERDERDRGGRAERDDHERGEPAEPRPTLHRDPARRGGISFDDEDLADYMHPDDVPPKPPAGDPDDRDA